MHSTRRIEWDCWKSGNGKGLHNTALCCTITTEYRRLPPPPLSLQLPPRKPTLGKRNKIKGLEKCPLFYVFFLSRWTCLAGNRSRAGILNVPKMSHARSEWLHTHNLAVSSFVCVSHVEDYVAPTSTHAQRRDTTLYGEFFQCICIVTLLERRSLCFFSGVWVERNAEKTKSNEKMVGTKRRPGKGFNEWHFRQNNTTNKTHL